MSRGFDFRRPVLPRTCAEWLLSAGGSAGDRGPQRVDPHAQRAIASVAFAAVDIDGGLRRAAVGALPAMALFFALGTPSGKAKACIKRQGMRRIWDQLDPMFALTAARTVAIVGHSGEGMLMKRALLRIAAIGLVASLVACSGGAASAPTMMRDPDLVGVPPPAAQRGTQTARQITIPASAKRQTQSTNVAIGDPGFESGGFTSWAQCGSLNATISTTHVHTGIYSERSGSTNSTTGEINGDAGVCQAVAIPANATLSFYVYPLSNESSTTYSYQEADLLNSSGATVKQFYASVSNAGAWTLKTFDLSAYAGQTLYLYFGVHGDGYASDYTIQYVDDVTITGAGATPTPVPTSTPTPGATPTPTPKPTASPTSTATPTPSPTPTPGTGPTPIPLPGGGGSSTCGVYCGTERWHVKTLDDPQASQVNRTPLLTTVDTLVHAAVPSGLSSSSDNIRFAPWELQTVKVRATFVGWKTEADNDYHVVIADMNHPSETMIIEPPSPSCSSACQSGYGSLFQSSRDALVACFGSPPSTFTGSAKTVVMDITGVPMFDLLHGQTGVAPNGIEIHPIVSISFVSGC